MEENKIDRISILKVCGKSLIIELILSMIGMFILALLLSKTGISDDIMGKAIIGISAFAISFGGLIASKKLEFKGILSGALQGIIYMLFLYLISSILSGNFSIRIEGITMIIIRYNFWRYWRNNWR